MALLKLYSRERVFAIIALIALCFCVFPRGESLAAREQTFQGVAQSRGEPVQLLPFLEYYLDLSMTMDIDEAAAPALAQAYKPLALDKLPMTEGVMWLRFTISALEPDVRPATFLLDMGQNLPGVPLLYTPEKNELSGALEWQENLPAHRNIFLLPEARHEPITCYIRVDGLPGVWFSPMIRTPQNAASNWGSLARTGAIVALAVIMLFCLMRGFGEKGQWRVWTSFFVAVALAQALLGMPPVSGSIGIRTLAAILTPGIALMLLPHIGRHLLHSRDTSRPIDIQLLLLSLPGAALAIMPLIPGWDWMFRWLDLWPLCALLFVPTALGAWLMGLTGARRFLLGCLIPPFFTGASLAGLFLGFPPYLLSSGPLWGIAFSAIALASVSSQWDFGNKEKKTSASRSPDKSLRPEQEEIVILEHPLDDPNLRILSPNFNVAESESDLESQTPQGSSPDSEITGGACEKLEKEMREPIDELLREGVALGHCALPPAARDHAEKMIHCAKNLTEILVSGPIYQNPRKTVAKSGNFNLQKLLRETTDSLSSQAENSGVSLSWHMPPHLDQWFLGDFANLRDTLSMLLESSIRASSEGGVRLSVKRAPDSSDPYYLQFTVSDNGAGAPPLDRSSLALAKAWELAGKNGGYLDMESSRHGTAITFSMRLKPPLEESDEQSDVEESSLHVVVAAENEEQRREIVKILEDLNCRISEATNAREVEIRQSMDPAPLLIARGKLALPSAGDMARQFATLAQKAGYARSFILAVTPDTHQWPLLKTSGFTHAMTEPVEADILRDTVRDFTQILLSARDEALALKASATALKNTDDPVQDAPDGDFSPSMIVDQHLEINYNFDTPDWLNAEKRRESTDDSVTTIIESPSQTSAPANDSNEWVGEPTPAAAPTSKAKEDSSTHSEDVSESIARMENTDEWVGEPSPIIKSPPEPESKSIEEDSTEATANEHESEKESKEPSKTLPDDNSPTTAPRTDERSIIDPVISEYVETLRVDMLHVTEAFERKDADKVAQGTEKIAKDADNFGFRQLSKLAQCVRRAASAGDFSAMNDLLPDLTQAAERYRIHLTQKYQ
ncbi:MAG: hypothetical protein HDQ93_04820 [Desulfovibrio sp.]|nr:hypothetical protein [Desulfovibrio sp.]